MKHKKHDSVSFLTYRELAHLQVHLQALYQKSLRSRRQLRTLVSGPTLIRNQNQ